MVDRSADSGKNPGPARHALGLHRLKAAAGLVVFAFVVGFGVADYLAYRADRLPSQILVARAVPIPALAASSQKAPALNIASNQSPTVAAKSPDVDSGAAASANAPDNPNPGPPENRSASDEGGGGVLLAKLVPGSGQHAGEIAHDFSLPDSAGKLVSLSEYRGKIVFLNFWATWCGTCRGEMTSLQSLYREFSDRRDLEFLAVSIDQEGWSKISPFLEGAGFDLTVLSDTESRVSSAYQVQAIPTTFIIGRDGRVVWNCTGAPDWTDANLKSALSKLFAPS